MLEGMSSVGKDRVVACSPIVTRHREMMRTELGC